MKKIIPYLFAVALFFIGGSDVFAYDFAHWKGASITDFGFRVVDNQWYSRSSNKEFEWLFRPDFPAGNHTLINIYQFGGILYVGDTTIKKGTATIQMALGYDSAYTAAQTCSWIDTFNGYSLEYSSNGENWTYFELNSFTCTPQDGFVIIGYNLNIPNDLTFNRFSFGIVDDESMTNHMNTLFTAVNIISSEDGTQAIINQNQTIIDQNNTQIQQGQETNENLEDIKDAITDDSIDVSTGNSFFDDFDVSDNGGISSVVTAPLSAIEKMVSGTCSPIKGSYRGKEFSLPCGNTFWSEMPDVKQFLNIVLGGFLCYGILAKLYLLIDRLKDPEDDRVDVMKL